MSSDPMATAIAGGLVFGILAYALVPMLLDLARHIRWCRRRKYSHALQALERLGREARR